MHQALKRTILIALVVLFCIETEALHLQSTTLYVDNLEQSNLNYYFGGMSPSSFYSNLNQFRMNNPGAQSCPPALPYANYTDKNSSCFACDPLTNDPNLKQSKVLFNVFSRECEKCTANKTEICNKILNGTFAVATNTSVTASTSPAPNPPANTATSTTPNATSTVPNTSTAPNTTSTQPPSSTAAPASSSNSTATQPTNTTANTTTTPSTPNASQSSSANTTSNNSTSTTTPNATSPSTNTTSSTASSNTTPTSTPATNASTVNSTTPTNPTSATPNSSAVSNTTNNTTNSSTQKTPTNSPSISAEAALKLKATLTSNPCQEPRPFFNKSTGLCDSCPPGTQFVTSQQLCLAIIYLTSPNTPKVILSTPTQLVDINQARQNQNPQRTLQFCPADKPYAAKDGCINCDQGQYFYLSKGECVTGCPQGTYYDANLVTCSPAVYYSDVNAPWIVSQQGNYQSWKAQVEAQAKSSPRMVICPKNKPFEVNGGCIECPSSTYFNIDQNQCLACGKNRNYDPNQRKCMGVASYRHSMKTYASSVV